MRLQIELRLQVTWKGYANWLRNEGLRQLAAKMAKVGGAVKIVLFGSVARGEQSIHSDLDLLLVLPTTNRQVLLNAAIQADIDSGSAVLTESAKIQKCSGNPHVTPKPNSKNAALKALKCSTLASHPPKSPQTSA